MVGIKYHNIMILKRGQEKKIVKTVKQIADELGVDKQKVYRYIKNNQIKECINESLYEAHQKNSVKYYNEAAETLIKQGIMEKSASSEVHHEVHQKHIKSTSNEVFLKRIEALEKELDIKNDQIDTLLRLVNQAQQLQAITEQKIKAIEEKEENSKKSWWSRIFGV